MMSVMMNPTITIVSKSKTKEIPERIQNQPKSKKAGVKKLSPSESLIIVDQKNPNTLEKMHQCLST